MAPSFEEGLEKILLKNQIRLGLRSNSNLFLVKGFDKIECFERFGMQHKLKVKYLVYSHKNCIILPPLEIDYLAEKGCARQQLIVEEGETSLRLSYSGLKIDLSTFGMDEEFNFKITRFVQEVNSDPNNSLTSNYCKNKFLLPLMNIVSCYFNRLKYPKR